MTMAEELIVTPDIILDDADGHNINNNNRLKLKPTKHLLKNLPVSPAIGRKREIEFGKEGIYYENYEIKCKVCDGKRLASKKSTIQFHCQGKKHRENSEKKKQNSVNISLGRKREIQFGNEGIYYEDNKIKCMFCPGKELASKKSTIMNHCQGKKHVKNMENHKQDLNNITSNVTSLIAQNNLIAHMNDNLITHLNFNNNLVREMNIDAARAFIGADIPLEKFDHPALRSFFSKYVMNGHKLYSSSQMKALIDEELTRNNHNSLM